MSDSAPVPLPPVSGPDMDRRARLVAAHVVEFAFSFAFVALRLWARFSINAHAADDWCLPAIAVRLMYYFVGSFLFFFFFIFAPNSLALFYLSVTDTAHITHAEQDMDKQEAYITTTLE